MSNKYLTSADVPDSILIARLHELSDAITKGRDSINREFTMRVPAEVDRDADLVLAEAARRISTFDIKRPGRDPIDMVLYCPRCRAQHIDAPEPESNWTNPPHRSHLCRFCSFVWRPADIPTRGVQSTKTCGTDDSPSVPPASTNSK